MYLERLELVGFKSFAQKAVLEFPAGITAIVGPNGSGKSNVIDAIRWLLGEREAKNVRGASVEDLIFSGTRERARMGMAQATIVFNNANKFFPVEFSEVSIRRRVGRDHTTQCYLNDAEVRLKDIIDFFAKARLGTKGFSIVNQGDSDLFVRAAPRDRRIMLEEILGLRQYELKRHEAEHKLKATRFNMEKVRALLDEITPHLRLLRRQTARWEKHAEVERELRELEDVFFEAQYEELARAEAKLAPAIEAKERLLKEKRKEELAFEARLREVERGAPEGKGDFETVKERREALLARRAALERELGRLEARLEFGEKSPLVVQGSELVRILGEARKIVKAALEELELVSVRALMKVLLGHLDRILPDGKKGDAREGREREGDRNKLTRELAEIEVELKELSIVEARIAGDLGAFNEVFRKAYEAIEAKKNEIRALETDVQKELFERERITLREQELNHQAAQAMRNPEEFRGKKREGGALAPAELSAIEKRLFRLRGELASIGEIDAALVKEADETEKRHAFLSSQLADLEKAAAHLSELIKELAAKIHEEFQTALERMNGEFERYFHAMFGGGRARLVVVKPSPEPISGASGGEANGEAARELAHEEVLEGTGIDVEVSIPRKKISSLEMLSGGERSLVSLAVLFAVISVSPPPFLVLDEVDAALDEQNSKRFSDLLKNFTKHTQFIVVTHNRSTMEAADILYGITMGEDGTSRVLSLKLEEAEREAAPMAHP